MQGDKSKRRNSARERILVSARRLFSQHGYQATSTDMLLTDLGISRGALYHHFRDKEDLFAAVLDAVEADLATECNRAAVHGIDVESKLSLAFERFLELACEGEVRQIVLTDAVAVLGWEKWRRVEAKYGLGTVKEALTAAALAGLLDRNLVNVYAHLLIAALGEAGFLVAQATDVAAARAQSVAALRSLLRNLFTSRESSGTR